MRSLHEVLDSLLYTTLAVAAVCASTALAGGGTVVTKPSNYSVPETLSRIEKTVKEKGMQIFVRINHGTEAKKVGLAMRPTELLIFGNPKGGTALMLAKPTAAIDLPMKALAWEDENGKVWLTYNSPELLHARHGVPGEFTSKLDEVGKLLEATVE